MLHAWLAGQSAALVQPQVLVAPVDRQALPAALPAQVAHSALPVAHLVPSVPATQVAPSQQPPLHAWLALQSVVQEPVAVLHA